MERRVPSRATPYRAIATFGSEAGAGSAYVGTPAQSPGFPSIAIPDGHPGPGDRRDAARTNAMSIEPATRAYRIRNGWRVRRNSVRTLASTNPVPLIRPFTRPLPLMSPWPLISPRRKRTDGERTSTRPRPFVIPRRRVSSDGPAGRDGGRALGAADGRVSASGSGFASGSGGVAGGGMSMSRSSSSSAANPDGASGGGASRSAAGPSGAGAGRASGSSRGPQAGQTCASGGTRSPHVGGSRFWG